MINTSKIQPVIRDNAKHDNKVLFSKNSSSKIEYKPPKKNEVIQAVNKVKIKYFIVLSSYFNLVVY